MEWNDAASGQSTSQEESAEATLGDESELESDYPSARDEAKRQPKVVVQKEEVGEANEIAAVSQNKEILTVIPQTPVEKQRPNEGKSLLTRDVRNFSGATKNKKTLWRSKSGHKKRLYNSIFNYVQISIW